MLKPICVDELSMVELIELLENELEEHGTANLSVPDPDDHVDRQSNLLSLKAWVDLAEVCMSRLSVPEKHEGRLLLTFKSLKSEDSFHYQHVKGQEKYGSLSRYAQIFKNDEPHFAKDYMEALVRCQIKDGSSILNFGVNRGDEFEVLLKEKPFKGMNLRLYGMDHSLSALQTGHENFKSHKEVSFLCADVEHVPLKLERKFDVFVSVNTLHGSKFDGKAVFREVFQNLLSKNGSVVLGFPNCRYLEGEVIYGGKMKNFARHDFSLLLKDLQYFKKYLQKHRKKVFLTGKYTLFLTAIPI